MFIINIMHKYVSLASSMESICTKFFTSASLRCTRFKLYMLRANITTMHQNFGQRITASPASNKVYMYKSHINRRNEETALLMFRLLEVDCSSVVKFKTVRSHGKLHQHGGPWGIWIFVSRKCWGSWHFKQPFENSWRPPGRKEINFPC